MPNEDIITALKNAIDKGEPLQQAIQVMISSGYDSREVQEASKFVGQGITPNLEQRPDEQLIMSHNKRFFTKIPQNQPTQPLPQSSTQNIQTQPTQQTSPQNINQSSQPSTSYQSTEHQDPENQKKSKEIKPTHLRPKKSYFKEIILVIILLILVGVLITTIFLKDQILGFFS